MRQSVVSWPFAKRLQSVVDSQTCSSMMSFSCPVNVCLLSIGFKGLSNTAHVMAARCSAAVGSYARPCLLEMCSYIITVFVDSSATEWTCGSEHEPLGMRRPHSSGRARRGAPTALLQSKSRLFKRYVFYKHEIIFLKPKSLEAFPLQYLQLATSATCVILLRLFRGLNVTNEKHHSPPSHQPLWRASRGLPKRVTCGPT